MGQVALPFNSLQLSAVGQMIRLLPVKPPRLTAERRKNRIGSCLAVERRVVEKFTTMILQKLLLPGACRLLVRFNNPVDAEGVESKEVFESIVIKLQTGRMGRLPVQHRLLERFNSPLEIGVLCVASLTNVQDALRIVALKPANGHWLLIHV